MAFERHGAGACTAAGDNALKVVTCGGNHEVASHAGHEMKNTACVFFSCGFTGNDNCAGINILRFETGLLIFIDDYIVNRFFIDGSFVTERSNIYRALVDDFLAGDFNAGNHVFSGSVFDGESAKDHLGSGSADINTYAQYLLFHLYCLP